MILSRLLVLFCLLVPLAQAQEFLDPALAFKGSARALDGQTVEIRYDIAPDYYLYKDKFRVRPADESIVVGNPQLPAGKEKNDDNFGRVEVYYKQAVVRVPVERNASGPLTLNVKVTCRAVPMPASATRRRPRR